MSLGIFTYLAEKLFHSERHPPIIQQMAQSKTTVLVADPLMLFSDALAIALASYRELSVFEDRPTNGPGTVTAVVKRKPDFALIDYWMPDMEGPVMTRSILAQVPQCNVILMSWLVRPEQIQEGLEAGAVGFLPKDARVAQVAEAIRQVYSGGRPEYAKHLQGLISDRNAQSVNELHQFETLTPRQIETLALINLGRSTSQIAKRLSISPKTVSNHISEILAKTGTFSQTEVLAKARACGFLRR